MQRFSKILLHASMTPPIPSKLRAASELVELNGAQITVMDVLPELPKRKRFRRAGDAEVDLQQASLDLRRQELSTIAAALSDTADVHVTAGSPHVEIVRQVIEGGYDLVVTGLDGPNRSRFVGAPTAMHLLRKCPVPVWVHSAASADRTGVGIALGPLDPDRSDAALNLKLLQLAASMAKRRDTPLHVMHAWELEGESMMRSPMMPLSTAEVDALRAEARAQAEQEVAAALEDVAHIGATPVVHLRAGLPGLVLPEMIQQLELETVVMGTLSKGGVRGALIGATAEKVFSEIDSSVLTVKPSGFVSPLAP